jgi:hypothetical protein
MKGNIMLDAHEVNKTKLMRFLTELLLTGEWSDEFEELEADGNPYWKRVMNLGLIRWTPYDQVSVVKISTAGRKFLNKGGSNEQ